ncbi:PREDICTED: uncharacterized protein LOC107355386 isoform X2 [Acropora digitifera]|uniref:uncharacterized protein LOC107355386 isoform X2 n=1 Tax=Acropora digitifera TaxID=70779 RepID=UPI00077A3536|nr:PREDICTED: uncharacterized protein LOC107355386 isoform X2 [Acropora digitifera]
MIVPLYWAKREIALVKFSRWLFRQFEMGSTEGSESLQWRNYAWYCDPETVAHEAATVCSLTDEERLLFLLKNERLSRQMQTTYADIL